MLEEHSSHISGTVQMHLEQSQLIMFHKKKVVDTTWEFLVKRVLVLAVTYQCPATYLLLNHRWIIGLLAGCSTPSISV